MISLDEIMEAPKEEPIIPQERALVKSPKDQMFMDYHHRVVNVQFHGYPRMSPLEAELMELMGDSLGG